MITGANESKILTKHISCKCECKFDGKKCNSNQKWNNDKCWCGCKNLKKHNVCKKDNIWNPTTCICENGKYDRIITGNSVTLCDKIKTQKRKFQQNPFQEKVLKQISIFYLLFY